MSKEVKNATIQTLIFVLLLFIVVGVSWYAALHPFFLFYILVPILGATLLVLVWLFFYVMEKIK